MGACNSHKKNRAWALTRRDVSHSSYQRLNLIVPTNPNPNPILRGVTDQSDSRFDKSCGTVRSALARDNTVATTLEKLTNIEAMNFN